ncbi:MAG: hypothetical protein WCE44_01750, partial [Candidatus Velthaea sp.]
GLDTAAALHAAESEGQSLESVIDGAPSASGDHPTSAHGGGETHDIQAEHGRGVTAETSIVEPSSQHSDDSAERPGATSAPGSGEASE